MCGIAGTIGLPRAAAQLALDRGLNAYVPRQLWGRFLRRDPRVVALQIIALWVLAEHASRTGLRVSA